MPQFTSTRKVAHSPEQMFALVADVERYPEFLPLCEGLTVLQRKSEESGETLLASMRVGYKAIHESFITRVMLKPQENIIHVSYVDGPFRYLTNIWEFKADAQGCEISFFIDYEFKNRMLGLLMGTMFDRAFRKFSEAFEQRANAIYT